MTNLSDTSAPVNTLTGTVRRLAFGADRALALLDLSALLTGRAGRVLRFVALALLTERAERTGPACSACTAGGHAVVMNAGTVRYA